MRGNFGYTQNETALEVIQQAAKKMHRKYSRYIEQDDLVQEAHIFVATKDDLQEAIAGEEWGLLQFRLERDLTDMLDTVVRRARRNTSYDSHEEGLAGASAVSQRAFSDLNTVGFRGSSEPVEHPVEARKAGA